MQTKTVLITGATSGFGYLLAEKFLQTNHRVIATGRNLISRQEIFAELRKKFPDNLIELNLDVTIKAEAKAATDFISKLGQLDILINNAGYGLFGAFEECSEEQIRNQFEVNFFGTLNLTQGLLPWLRKSRGQIYNFSSIFGITTFPLTSLYCASKFALEGWSESLHFELAPHGVSVCLIEPGGYRTKFTNNKVWAAKSDQFDSIYKLQTENYKRLSEKLATQPNPQDPQDVANCVVELSKCASLPLRVKLGKDARAMALFRSITPSPLFKRLSQKIYNRILLKANTQ